MKKHNLFKVVGITILVTVLLTWILPTTYYQYSLVSDGTRSQVGLFYTKYGQEIHIGIKGESDLHGNRRRWKSILLRDKICWD